MGKVRDENLISLQNLILISISSVIRKKTKCSYGDLVKECFELFPNDFSLSEHSQWPDSLKLDRPIRDLREQGLIKGSVRTFFTLTDYGKQVIKQVQSNLKKHPKHKTQSKTQNTRSPGLKVLDKIRKSEDFKQYLNNRIKAPNDMRMRDILGYTLETPRDTIINFLNYLKTRIITEKKLTEYLNLYINYLKK